MMTIAFIGQDSMKREGQIAEFLIAQIIHIVQTPKGPIRGYNLWAHSWENNKFGGRRDSASG